MALTFSETSLLSCSTSIGSSQDSLKMRLSRREMGKLTSEGQRKQIRRFFKVRAPTAGDTSSPGHSLISWLLGVARAAG